jgi:aspartate 1-decarboxylase
MLRSLLKSKIHRATITGAEVDYEGSISIPQDLMLAADLWEGEKVLVASITSGARLETYVIPDEAGTGEIIIRGGAAHLIGAGHLVTILAFTWSESPVTPHRILCGKNNTIKTSPGLKDAPSH